MSPTTAALDLRISIADTEPEIWREVRVPESIPLPHLHQVIQRAFGWMNAHLHMFVAADSAGDRRLFASDEGTARELGVEYADGFTLEDVASAIATRSTTRWSGSPYDSSLRRPRRWPTSSVPSNGYSTGWVTTGWT